MLKRRDQEVGELNTIEGVRFPAACRRPSPWSSCSRGTPSAQKKSTQRTTSLVTMTTEKTPTTVRRFAC